LSTPEPEDGPRDSSARLEDCDWEQIADYVAHRATLAERAALEARMARDAAFRVHVERARLAWERARDALDRPTTPAEFAGACRQLAAQLDEPVASLLRAARAPAMSAAAGEPPPARAPIVLPRRRERVPRWRVTAMAATVVLGVGVGATWLALRESAPPPLREIATARGERLTVPLDDGSRVVLAPGSRLTVPERFARDARTVTLAGHAYFEVAPEAARPFLVQTPGAVETATAVALNAQSGVTTVTPSAGGAAAPGVLPTFTPPPPLVQPEQLALPNATNEDPPAVPPAVIIVSMAAMGALTLTLGVLRRLF